LIYKEERIYLLLVMAVFYCVTYYLLKGIHLLLIFNYFMLGAAMLAILSAIISYYRKISLHMLAAGSTVGLFTGLSLNYGIMFTSEILICVFLSGLIGFARLRTESHTPGEVYAGFILGSALMTSLVFLF
jgi:membrane-associated phospholipid phosphatase